jgi:hypothetical protein
MQPKQAQLWVAIARGQHIPGKVCSVHGGHAQWWRRGCELICTLCHPDPSTLYPEYDESKPVRANRESGGNSTPDTALCIAQSKPCQENTKVVA